MAIHKKGLAHWEGDLKHGKGTVSTESGALSQQPYGFNTRFEGVKGTNPEELIGAAHAACFSMALSLMLSEEGYTATSIDTTAVVTLNKTDGGFAITDIALQSQIVLPDVSPAAFDEIIQKAKAAGVKFTFGSNNITPEVGTLDYCIRMKKECGLTAQDMYKPHINI